MASAGVVESRTSAEVDRVLGAAVATLGPARAMLKMARAAGVGTAADAESRLGYKSGNAN
jgi:hypothetical protein